jgi:hypothetical protein
MALLVREKPPVLVVLAAATVVVVTGRFGVGALVVAGEPEFTVVVAVGVNEAGVKGVGSASGFEDFGSVDEDLADAVDEVAVVAEDAIVVSAVVVGLLGVGRGVGAGRRVTTDLGAFRGAVVVAAEAEATPIPAVIEERAIVAAIHRAAVREVRCWVMPATYELDLKPHWESKNSFRQLPQRSLRLAS